MVDVPWNGWLHWNAWISQLDKAIIGEKHLITVKCITLSPRPECCFWLKSYVLNLEILTSFVQSLPCWIIQLPLNWVIIGPGHFCHLFAHDCEILGVYSEYLQIISCWVTTNKMVLNWLTYRKSMISSINVFQCSCDVTLMHREPLALSTLLTKKTPSYWYKDSHYKPDTVIRPS